MDHLVSLVWQTFKRKTAGVTQAQIVERAIKAKKIFPKLTQHIYSSLHKTIKVQHKKKLVHLDWLNVEYVTV